MNTSLRQRSCHRKPSQPSTNNHNLICRWCCSSLKKIRKRLRFMFTKAHFCLKLNQVSTETKIKEVKVELEMAQPLFTLPLYTKREAMNFNYNNRYIEIIYYWQEYCIHTILRKWGLDNIKIQPWTLSKIIHQGFYLHGSLFSIIGWI